MQTYGGFLRRYLAPQAGAVAAMAVLLLGSIGLQLAGPQVIRRFIEAGTPGRAALPELIQWAILFMVVTTAARAVRAMAAYWSERVAWAATNALRIDLLDHLLRLDLSFHKDRTAGELIERVDGDTGALAGFFSRMVVQFLGSGLLMAGILVSLALIDLWLGLGFAAFIILTIMLLNWLRARSVPRRAAAREKQAQVYGLLSEVLSATEDLQSSGAGAHALRRFTERLQEWFPAHRVAELSGSLVWVAGLAAFAAADGVAYLLGGRLFLIGRISLGTLFLVAAYAGQLAQPIETIRREMQELQRAGAGLARVRELFAIRPRVAEGSGLLPAGPLGVAFQGVSFAYEDGVPVLDRLTFGLAPGQVLGVVGRTGSGKSTLARLLVRQIDPTGGRVLVGGVDLRTLAFSSLRSRVAMVTQEVQLFAATLRENLTLFDPSVPDERLRDVLAQLGLGAWSLDAQVAPGSLSAGEAQLLAFARVFLGDPGLIILDEASSRLDPETEARLDEALSRLLDGRTAIIIAHRPATLRHAHAMLEVTSA
ncbi:MAG: transporter ATP-binding protein [Symbiobacteriaceae bacterium]|jgi:ATP-binding cassette subfamily B protein|nr:transporter ATP-binding protein [Symbiobacteriaceae bacterium]